MSNIYDSANELSRGLRELPEYKAVKAAKDAIAADAEASKIFYRICYFPRGNSKTSADRSNARRFLPSEDGRLGKQIQGNSLLSEFFTKQQQLAIYLSDIEKLFSNQFQNC